VFFEKWVGSKNELTAKKILFGPKKSKVLRAVFGVLLVLPN
jgi:hypothetical protein